MIVNIELDGIHKGEPVSIRVEAEDTAQEAIEILKVYPALAAEMISVIKKSRKGK